MFALIFVAPLLFALQSSAFKKYGLSCDNSNGGKAFFSTLYLIASAVVAVPFALMAGAIQVELILYGLGFGIVFYVFLELYSEALKNGPYAVTVFLFAMSMVIPIIFSAIFLEESFKGTQIIGFILMIIALYFINFAHAHSREGRFSKKWIFLCIAGFIANGLLQLYLKLFSLAVPSGDISQFLLFAYIMCVLLSMTKFMSSSAREEVKNITINRWFVILCLIVSCANFFGNYFVTLLAGSYDAQMFFPINNGSSIIFNVFLSIFLFKEKLQTKTVIGILVGVGAIVLLSL